MDSATLLPQTPEQTKVAALAFAGILGGGLIAYEAGRSIRDGDLFKTDDFEGKPEVGAAALVVGLGMFAMMVKEAVKDVGWKPLALGSAAIFGVAVVARAARG